MFSKFDEEAQKVLLIAKKEMAELKHPYVGTEHLLLAILHNDNLEITKFLKQNGITYSKYKREIIKVIGMGSNSNNWYLFTPLLKRVIENASLDSRGYGNLVSVERLFMALLAEGEGVANRVLMGMNIDIDALYEKFDSNIMYNKKESEKPLQLEEYATNLNDLCIREGFDPVIGRDDVVFRIFEILLRRTKNNPLLIGEAGVGKTAIVEEVVRRIVQGEAPKRLENVTVYSLALSSLVAGTRYRGEFEERINKIIKEVEDNPNIILFIDEIHTLVGAGGAEGAIDASNILKPYLARGKIKIIGATTKKEYSKFFDGDKAFDRRFQKIIVEEPCISDVCSILFNLRNIYEEYHNVEISDEIVKLIVQLTDKYVTYSRFPDKAIDVLDEACSKVVMVDSPLEKKAKALVSEINSIKQKKNKYIIEHKYEEASMCKEKQCKLEAKLNTLVSRGEHSVKRVLDEKIIYEIISKKTKIPVWLLINPDKSKVIKKLESNILGQDNAIEEIVNTIFSRQKKTPSSFLLIGKSGIGKTLMVEEYAKALYSEEAFIRVDMSEYRESHSVSKIIGSPPGYIGYNDTNNLLDRIKINSYSVLLLDEVEKASPEVLKLFLQVMDSGYMSNASLEKVDFRNVTIFMTSNLGCDTKSVGFKENSSVVNDKIRKYFGNEFVNRIDKILFFNELDINIIKKIVVNKLKKNKIPFSTKTVDKIILESEYQKYGARKIDKIIEKELLENKVNQ